LWLQTRRWRAGRVRVSTLRDLLALSPPAFERAVASLLTDRGYRRVERLGGAGDLMADIRAIDSAGRTVVVQCKRYAPNRRVSSPEVQAFIGMVQVHHHAQVGMYVTTSDFTAPARALAREHGVVLVDGATLSDWVSRARRPRRVERSEPVVSGDGAAVHRASSHGMERRSADWTRPSLDADVPDDLPDAPEAR
ncbi:MAG TPA: restriction endonuclease, partial [Thermomicrobiaceae bacterium]|nr:restriction endonuclease [Thermomicrobiaceae bacterium]